MGTDRNRPVRDGLNRLYHRNRTVLALAVGLYAVGCLSGLLLALGVSTEQMAQLADLAGSRESPRQSSVRITTLLVTNLVSITIILAGTVTFGVTTVGNLLLNGFLHSYALAVLPPSAIAAVALFVPHAVFELPSLWLAGGAGLRVPYEFVRYVRGEKDRFLTETDLRDVLVLAVLSVLAMTSAILVESQVTTRIGDLVLGG